jgi:hypothetical protein
MTYLNKKMNWFAVLEDIFKLNKMFDFDIEFNQFNI